MALGMLVIGKAKPESMKAGLRKKNPEAKACCWVDESVEMSRPTPRVLRRNRTTPSSSTSGLPRKGTWNQRVPTTATRITSARPTTKKGMVLPRMNSKGLIGVTMTCSSVPISRSRTIANAVRVTTIISVMLPITPGTKNH